MPRSGPLAVLLLALFLLPVPVGPAAAAPASWRSVPSTQAAALLEALAEPEPDAAPAPAPAPPVTAPLAPGANVRVNDPSLDTPESTTQNEVTLALRGSTLCAGYIDTGTGPTGTGFARSTDGGQSWSDQGGVAGTADPVHAVHLASGTFYRADIALLPVVGLVIGVARSTDDCQSFGPYVNTSPSSMLSDFEDKGWIAVDNSGGAGDGTVYACWSRFVNGFPGPATSGELRFSRSLDGGLSFQDEQVVAPLTDFFPFGCFVDVGPGGEVYVSWANRGTDDIRFRRSLDGGLSWDSVVTVNGAPVRAPGIDRVISCEPGVSRTTLQGDIRMLAQTWMAVDRSGGPHGGNLYLAWASDPVGSPDHSDVYFARSTNGGQSWSTEAQLGGGTATDQFEPFLRVAGDGTLAVAWYDRRLDPGNDRIDVYRVHSKDGGASFGPLVRLTDTSFPVPPLTGQPSSSGNFDPRRSACYMGEYIAMEADAHRFYYAWGDNRNTLVTATYPLGRPDPDVYFSSEPASCGDGVLDLSLGEECDDGNTSAFDCCSPSCRFEDGVGTPPCCSAGVCQVGQGCGAVCFEAGGVCQSAGGPGTLCSCTLP